MGLSKFDIALYHLALGWISTGDIYYRDTLKARVEVLPNRPSELERLAHAHLIEFPDDPHYKDLFEDRIRDIRANPSIFGVMMGPHRI